MDDWKNRVTQVISTGLKDKDPDQACLVLIYPVGPELGKRFELNRPALIIGRGSDCDIQVDRDSVSRKHARIERRSGAWMLVDLESTNGTYVDDRPIFEHQLLDGDLVKIGSTIFKFLTGGNIETAYYEEIYRMTIIDGLTQAYNKRFLVENLERELARCARSKRPLSLVMIDIDFFKKINDEYGHLTGDHVLKELARRIKGRIRRDEIFARYGGEEFAVMLPEAPLENALQFAEQVRSLVEQDPFEFDADRLKVTISLGVACVTEDLGVDDFIKMADENLYRAKRSGRNRVIG
jgi:two-component system cell cycle response regulator